MKMAHAQPSIKPWKVEDTEQKSIPFLISRIIDQRGGFRNITEESLQEEIATGEAQVEDDAESAAEKGDDDDKKPRAEQVQAARQEMMKFAQ